MADDRRRRKRVNLAELSAEVYKLLMEENETFQKMGMDDQGAFCGKLADELMENMNWNTLDELDLAIREAAERELKIIIDKHFNL